MTHLANFDADILAHCHKIAMTTRAYPCDIIWRNIIKMFGHAVRRWVDQVRKERLGSTPVGAKAITADQREIQRLKALLREKDLDIEILKKASALLLLDAKDHSR